MKRADKYMKAGGRFAAFFCVFCIFLIYFYCVLSKSCKKLCGMLNYSCRIYEKNAAIFKQKCGYVFLSDIRVCRNLK